MADERTQHEDEIFAIKQLFTNMAKPKSSDFGILIDMADNDPIYVHHLVPGTGNLEFHEDLNATVNFVTSYNEIHYFLHSVFGTYIFTNFDHGAYGQNNTKVTADQFIHVAPHPNIIDDVAPSESNAFSSYYISENYQDNDQLATHFVSRTSPTQIGKGVDINSKSGIYASNIMSNLRYEEGGTEGNPAGMLRFDVGTKMDAEMKEIEINPFTEWKVVDVPASGAAPNIALDFNSVAVPLRTFKRGDLVILNYDLTNIYDATVQTVVDYGTRLFMLTKDFSITDEEVRIESTADYVSITKIGLHEMKELFYEKDEVDLMLSNAANGVSKTLADTSTMHYGGADSPEIPSIGTQMLVNDFQNSDNHDGIRNIPADGVDPQVQGIFVNVDDAGTFWWDYAYSFKVPHKHENTDLIGLKDWVKKEQYQVFLNVFDENDSSRHFTKALQDKYDQADTDLNTLETRVGTTDSTGLSKRIKDNETNITTLGQAQTSYLPLTGGSLSHTLSITENPNDDFALKVFGTSAFSSNVNIQQSTFGDIVVIGNGGSQAGSRFNVNGYGRITERLGIGGDADSNYTLKVHGEGVFTNHLYVDSTDYREIGISRNEFKAYISNGGYDAATTVIGASDGTNSSLLNLSPTLGLGVLKTPLSGYGLAVEGRGHFTDYVVVDSPDTIAGFESKFNGTLGTRITAVSTNVGELEVRNSATTVSLKTTASGTGIMGQPVTGFALAVTGKAKFTEGIDTNRGSGPHKFWTGSSLPATRHDDTIYFIT